MAEIQENPKNNVQQGWPQESKRKSKKRLAINIPSIDMDPRNEKPHVQIASKEESPVTAGEFTLNAVSILKYYESTKKEAEDLLEEILLLEQAYQDADWGDPGLQILPTLYDFYEKHKKIINRYKDEEPVFTDFNQQLIDYRKKSPEGQLKIKELKEEINKYEKELNKDELRYKSEAKLSEFDRSHLLSIAATDMEKGLILIESDLDFFKDLPEFLAFTKLKDTFKLPSHPEEQKRTKQDSKSNSTYTSIIRKTGMPSSADLALLCQAAVSPSAAVAAPKTPKENVAAVTKEKEEDNHIPIADTSQYRLNSKH